MSQESSALTDEKSRKRHRPSWKKEQPAFLDASASVSASTFGARRTPELKQLYLQRHQYSSLTNERSVVAQDVAFQSGGGQTSSRHLRRRITSHKSRRHRHRFPTSGPEKNQETKTLTRKAKRSSPSTLAQGHNDWNKVQISPNLETKRVQWMATHLWHAKRFHMETLWGWQVPVAHTNRGARATLRLSRTHCLIQELTWERRPSIYLEFSRDRPTSILVQGLSRILPSWAMDSSIAKRLEQNTIVTGECIIHHIDQFPRGAIGPVWWRVENDVLQIMGHPSIQPRVIENIVQLRTNLPTLFREAKKETLNGILHRCCVFRLSGTGVRKALERCIGLQLQGQLSEASEMLPHGATVDVTIELPGVDDVVSVLLVRIQPRSIDCPENRVIAGWDLYCESQFAGQIWAQLSMNCVAIGMVDQSHLQLECEPPLPLFPRDFVDSEESSKYWLPSSEPDRCNSQTSWCRVRQLYEGGWGRLPIGKSLDLKGIQWSKLLLTTATRDDDDATDVKAAHSVDVVVVRGPYGTPFVTVLEGCGRMLESSTNDACSRSRRNRRRTRPVNLTTKVQPASKDEIEEWRHGVRSLLVNLSLPAVLQAHIAVSGKGTLQCGDNLLVGGSDVGVVTAGSFSSSRGHCHGLGILGAARLLKRISEENMPVTFGRITRLLNGQVQLRIAGTVVSSSTNRDREARDVTLSLLL